MFKTQVKKMTPVEFFDWLWAKMGPKFRTGQIDRTGGQILRGGDALLGEIHFDTNPTRLLHTAFWVNNANHRLLQTLPFHVPRNAATVFFCPRQ